MKKPEKTERGAWIANKTFLSIWGSFFTILLIILTVVINVSTQMEDIEEKLKYIPPQTKADAIPTESVVTGQMVYVPTYSHIYTQGGKPLLLESTLSIRNTDTNRDISITSVRYYDTHGKLINNFVENPLRLDPLVTAEFLIPQKEIAGGSGANFIVEWVSGTQVNKPIIEAVMVSTQEQTGISFVRSGIEIEN